MEGVFSRKTSATICAIFILQINLTPAQAQSPSKLWDADFGGSLEDELYSLQQTSDGGYVLFGSSESGIEGDKTQDNIGGEDYWVVKIDANGVKQWDATFGGSGDEEGRYIEQTDDGGYILGGYSDSDSGNDKTENGRGKIDYWIVKIDANGTKQWDATFGSNESDFLRVVIQTSDGGYILGGQSQSDISGDKTQANWGLRDFWIVKTDAHGVKQWDARYGGTQDEFFRSIIETNDGGYLVGGRTESGISGDVTGESRGDADFWIIKIGAQGAKQWDARYGGDKVDVFYDFYKTNDDGYIVGGVSHSGISGDKTMEGHGGADFWMVKTDSNGVEEWDAGYGGDETDYLYSIQQLSNGDYLLGGRSASGATGDKSQPTRGGKDYWMIKTDSKGTKLWDVSFGGSEEDHFYFSQPTTDGGYILGGRSESDLSGDKSQDSKGETDFWIVKTFPENVGIQDPDALANFTIQPNPAEDQAIIQFTLTQSSHVCIKVLDVSGKEIETLMDENVKQENLSVPLNTTHFPKGVYLVKMISDFGIENQKLIVQ